MPDIRTLAVLSPFVGGDYFGALIAGVNRTAVEAGDRVVAIQTLNPGAVDAETSGVPDFRQPIAWSYLDGVIVLPGAIHPWYAKSLRDAGLPVVAIGHQLPGADASVVLADNRGGVEKGVNHLIEHGHERIAFGGDLDTFDVRERYEAYRASLLEHGIEPDPALLMTSSDNMETGGQVLAEKLLAAGMPATAVVLGTDRNAVGLIGTLAAAGLDVPADLAVLGFDNIPDAQFLRPSLSTVKQPLDRLAQVAYELLTTEDEQRTATTHTVASLFIARDSCGCPPKSLEISEAKYRTMFQDNVYLDQTLNIQYRLSFELLGRHDRDPLDLSWLRQTPAIGGCLGLWREDDHPAGKVGEVPGREIEIVGSFTAGRQAPAAKGTVRAAEFPPVDLFGLADGAADATVFVVPVRSETQDWGLLAAVGRIQDTTPPGREMMNHSGSLLAMALEQDALLRSLQESDERLRQAALHDDLTGLPNRALFAERLRQAWHRSTVDPDHSFALLFLDLDGFKHVNDSLGHGTGDQLLIYVARRLNDLLREGDTAARLGGDEFVILLDGVELPHGPNHVSDRIRNVFVDPVVLDGHEVRVGASVGVATSIDGLASPEDVLRHADAAMYDTKLRQKAARAA